ncbi:MAG: hypothetical protein ACO3A2_09895 [Bdellovibrionia bacterium]
MMKPYLKMTLIWALICAVDSRVLHASPLTLPAIKEAAQRAAARKAELDRKVAAEKEELENRFKEALEKIRDVAEEVRIKGAVSSCVSQEGELRSIKGL